jgi:zona occludens toxin (predicted ATPase)
MTGAALLVIGVVALFAAIVGGGIKIKEIEVGSVPSLWRQALLAIFGLVVGAIGLALYFDSDESSTANGAPTENVANSNEAEATVDENAVDANAADPSGAEAGDSNQAEAPAAANAE